MLNIVLLEPEIPANTGNIGRTCVATGSRLHLIEPLGFKINEKQLRRAGMDYWKDLDVTVYDNFADFLEKNPECQGKLYMATTKAKHVYTDVAFEEDAYIMFGKESAGIPEEILVEHEEFCVRIPMLENIRSLNLSNSVAIVLYEALRQQSFKQMQLLDVYKRQVSFDVAERLETWHFVDGVMYGEGEDTFRELMACWNGKIDIESVLGIGHRHENGRVHVHPARDFVNMSGLNFVYTQPEDFKNKIIYYETSRGCPFQCSYCLSSVEKKAVSYTHLDVYKRQGLCIAGHIK